MNQNDDFKLNKAKVQRILGSKKHNGSGPSVIMFGGIHGNEPAGVIALNKVIQEIEKEEIGLNGNFYAIAGNLKALEKNMRFQSKDLNRIWTQENISILKNDVESSDPEINEQIDLYQIVKSILKDDNGPFYFIDLHTTSSDTSPFITISDSLNNRKFTEHFSIPIVLGIEEYLDGPLLTFMNEFGHVALGFEAGQHHDLNAIKNCEAFIWLTLEASTCLDKAKIVDFETHSLNLKEAAENTSYFEIDYRYLLGENEDFMMLNGFKNFDRIKKDQILAISNEQEIKANMEGQIFMPLYQDQGEDGYFIITKISPFWLNLSTLVRKLKLHHLLRLLPGIKQDPLHKYTLIVDPRTAKFLAVEIFHLFGYRKKISRNNKLHFIKRDRDIKIFN